MSMSTNVPKLFSKIMTITNITPIRIWSQPTKMNRQGNLIITNKSIKKKNVVSPHEKQNNKY